VTGNAPYRGRLAPSPTGLLHLGHARTFFTAFTRASNASGTLLMRMDDLDADRSRAEYIDAALEDLAWLGIRWAEPVICQSRRHALYLDAWHRLAQLGWLYPCSCTRRELASIATAPHELEQQPQPDDEPIYPGTCRSASSNISHGNPGNQNWRFRVPDGEVVEFLDKNLGPQRFTAGIDFGDFLVWRRDGTPSYQLACAVDDADLAITEVVRGADLLKSTARQILILRALSQPQPAWFHCPLVTDQNNQRLAKRHDALAIRKLRAQGRTVADILHGNIGLI